MSTRNWFVVLLIALLPAGASAAPCAGGPPFNDVPVSDFYCTNVEWLKNRGITSGCTATDFCPGNAVSRAAMAVFLNNLADTLIVPPAVTEETFGAKTLTFLSNDNPVCQTATIAAVGYPRVMSLSSHLTVAGANTPAAVGTTIRRSLNGGSFSLINSDSQTTTTDNTYRGNASHAGVITIAAGTTVAFHMGIFTEGGSTALASGKCALLLTIQSVTGSSTPFDSHSAGGPGE